MATTPTQNTFGHSTSTLVRGRLGKLAPRVDPRTLSLAHYVDRSALPVPPAELDLGRGVGDWPMYGNDLRGDCTIAAAGHMIEVWSEAAAGRAVEISEASVLQAFDLVKVVDPDTGEEGAVELEVLRLWRRSGIGGHVLGAFAAVPVSDDDLVRTAAFLFGGVYIGLQLPLRAQEQAVWDWTGRLDGPDRPGSWGGHAVNVVAYDADGLIVVTWGALQRLTWSFWTRYCDEAWALISPDFVADGHSPQGFDLDALKQDLALVTAGGGQ